MRLSKIRDSGGWVGPGEPFQAKAYYVVAVICFDLRCVYMLRTSRWSMVLKYHMLVAVLRGVWRWSKNEYARLVEIFEHRFSTRVSLQGDPSAPTTMVIMSFYYTSVWAWKAYFDSTSHRKSPRASWNDIGSALPYDKALSKLNCE